MEPVNNEDMAIDSGMVIDSGSEGINNNDLDVPASSRKDDDVLPPPPSPAPSRLPTDASVVEAAEFAVPSTSHAPMSPARISFIGNENTTTSVPMIAPVTERFQRSVGNWNTNGGYEKGSQGAAAIGGSGEGPNVNGSRQTSQSQSFVRHDQLRGSGDSSRGYKEMLEVLKRLNTSADKLQERICNLHCNFADTMLKAAFLFDPTTVQILATGRDNIPPANLPRPLTTQSKQQIDDNYECVIQRLESERAASSLNQDQN